MALPIPGRVAEALRRSTVRVTSGRAKEQEGDGSGVVLTGARVVTNAHVVRGEHVSVESWEGNRVPASLLKIDRGRDLALLGVVDGLLVEVSDRPAIGRHGRHGFARGKR